MHIRQIWLGRTIWNNFWNNLRLTYGHHYSAMILNWRNDHSAAAVIFTLQNYFVNVLIWWRVASKDRYNHVRKTIRRQSRRDPDPSEVLFRQSNSSTSTPTVPESRVMMVPTTSVNNAVNIHPVAKPYYPYTNSGIRRRSYTMCSGVVSSWPRSW